MGNGMNKPPAGATSQGPSQNNPPVYLHIPMWPLKKILPGLFVGNIRDAQSHKILEDNNITHILAIHDTAKKIHPELEYLCIKASDTPGQNLRPFFTECIDFIHQARLSGGNVLVHCLAGISRSVTVTVAYIMTITELNWRDSLNSVRGARKCANPNFGFQKQLQDFQVETLAQEKTRLKGKFAPSPYKDEEECQKLLAQHRNWVLYGDAGDEFDPDDFDTSKDLYPLPHNAYKPPAANANPGDTDTTESTDNDTFSHDDKDSENNSTTKSQGQGQRPSKFWNDGSPDPADNPEKATSQDKAQKPTEKKTAPLATEEQPLSPTGQPTTQTSTVFTSAERPTPAAKTPSKPVKSIFTEEIHDPDDYVTPSS